MYSKWHAIIVELRASDRVFDQMLVWCQTKFGTRRRPQNLWDWGTNAGYSLWFAFKNKEDCALFVLVWGSHVRSV